MSEAETPEGADRYVALAEVAKPHGLAGELRLHVYNPQSEFILDRPPARFTFPDGRNQSATIRSARRVSGGILIRVAGVDDRQRAEAMRGARLEVLRGQLGEPVDADEYYVCDLQGCRAFADGRELGTVSAVLPYPSCDALVVTAKDGSQREIPMLERFIAAVDVAGRSIELRRLDELE